MAFTRGGTERARVTTAPDGRYRVLLAPGTYRIRLTHPLAWRVRPTKATVYAGGLRRLNLYVDTRIP